jgi:hypothetical protein
MRDCSEDDVVVASNKMNDEREKGNIHREMCIMSSSLGRYPFSLHLSINRTARESIMLCQGKSI